MTAATSRVTWRAGADKVAHAHLPRQQRTLCGERVVIERLAWPTFRHCMVCAALADEPRVVSA